MDFYKSLRWLRYFQQIFIYSSFIIQKSEYKKNVKFSKLLLCYKIIYFIISGIILYYALMYNELPNVLLTTTKSTKLGLYRLLSGLEIFVSIFGFVVVFFLTFYHYKNHVELIELIAFCDKILIEKLKTNLNYKKFEILSGIIILFNVFFILFIQLPICLKLFTSPDGPTDFYVLVYTLAVIVLICERLSIFFYVILFYIRMKIVYKELEILSKNCKLFNDIENMICYFNLYKKLCHGIEIINNISGFTSVVSFAHSFTTITSQYFIIFWIMTQNRDFIEKFQMIIVVLVVLMPKFLTVVIITLGCHLVINKVLYFLKTI